ncbi:MAG: 4-alpha-glucanotransferase [Ignavibacteria bacterium]|jgi:4-alpha-glucanotransferase
MNFIRSAGILLHPTSLPGKYGIGELGSEIYKFINFISDSRQTLWQVFPLGPTGYGDSPYQCFSAFAGNPLLISIEKLIEDGLLSESEIGDPPLHDPHKIDYGSVINYKNGLLKKAFENYRTKNNSNNDYENFCNDNKEWLDDYALFMSCKNYHKGIVWKDWEEEIAFRKPGAVEKWTKKLADDIFYQKFLQYIFYEQWTNVKKYANEKGIKIIGDIPIFIAYDSSDLWANKELFTINDKGNLETVAGVPPDYFSETGQLWGNPLYKWDEMAKDNYLWWQKRFSKMYEFVDIVRIDHFRGFEAYYEIPGDAETAIDGKWCKAPGYELFETLKKELGDVAIIAEDLGIITKEVRKLRDHFNFPGMKVLQFAFGVGGDKSFLPHNHVQNSLVYTGTHDNDTTRAFFEKEKANGSEVFKYAQKYLNYYGDDMRYEIIRTAYSSVANIVVVPLQDWLNLGTEARMNFPGTLGGNWTWRFTWDQIHDGLAEHIKELTILYERPKEDEDEEPEITTE